MPKIDNGIAHVFFSRALWHLRYHIQCVSYIPHLRMLLELNVSGHFTKVSLGNFEYISATELVAKMQKRICGNLNLDFHIFNRNWGDIKIKSRIIGWLQRQRTCSHNLVKNQTACVAFNTCQCIIIILPRDFLRFYVHYNSCVDDKANFLLLCVFAFTTNCFDIFAKNIEAETWTPPYARIPFERHLFRQGLP